MLPSPEIFYTNNAMLKDLKMLPSPGVLLSHRFPKNVWALVCVQLVQPHFVTKMFRRFLRDVWALVCVQLVQPHFVTEMFKNKMFGP